MKICEYCSKEIVSQYPKENHIDLVYNNHLSYHSKCFELASGIKRESLDTFGRKENCLCCDNKLGFNVKIFYHYEDNYSENVICLNCAIDFLGLKIWNKLQSLGQKL
jgi:hypothetical protein